MGGYSAFGGVDICQVLACTGSDGTRVYVRRSDSNSIEDGWELEYHALGARGSMCTWSRAEKWQGKQMVRLAVATRREEWVEPKVLVINFQIGKVTVDCAHELNVTGAPKAEISSLSWNRTG